MGVFALFRKNKNIITDNGLNIIHYDNGKGTIKEQFTKLNGLIDGEYIEYDRNGNCQKKEYKNGERCLTLEEKQQKEIQDGINIKIQQQIDELLILDNLVSDITQIPHLMQMENLTIENYTKWIYNKLSNRFDEELIKFYLFSKRNFFIKDFTNLGDITRLENDYFREELSFFPRKRLIPKKRFEWYNYTLGEQILGGLLIDKHSGGRIKCEISIGAYGIYQSIFSQDSVFFGLNFNSYKLINDVLNNSEEQFKKHPSLNKIEREEMIIEIATNEINLICNNNKINQEEILLIAQDFKQG